MKNSIYNNYRSGVRVLVSFVVILNVLFLFSIFTVQIIEHDKYNDILEKETVLVKEEEGHRGKIYDTNNIELANNIIKFDFWVNTSENFDRDKIASLFSKTFDKDKRHYYDLLKTKKHYLPIEKNIEQVYCSTILDSIKNINGLKYNFSLKRFYPYDNLTANIIGFFNNQDGISSGIESYFNNILSGEKLDVKHQVLDNQKIKHSYIEIPSGKNIGLTIDLDLQTILVNELKKGLADSGAESANGIIVDPNTGDILAMVSIPDFNANKYNEYNKNNYRNRVISDNYEPGSTYKIVALVAAIENSKINIQDSIYCEDGFYTLKNGHILHDHEPKGVLSIPDIFAFSSNIGMAKIADLLYNQELYNKSREFGFGVKTGILLPNEQSGKLRNPKDWTYLSNKSVAIGQEISCTNLQLAMAYSAIANGGYLLQPSIIKHINNKTLKNSPVVIRKVMSQETSKIMLELLGRVVDYGSGTNAFLKEYGVGGKTGTAQKFIDGKYSENKYVSSFASIFPIQNPKYVCIVSVDSPDRSRGKHWGNETAAPIIKEIYKKIINLKDIKSETFVFHNNNNNNDDDDDESFATIAYETGVIPDFRGKTLKQALEIGRDIGIEINPHGFSGRVVWQSIKPGVDVDDIKICELKVE